MDDKQIIFLFGGPSKVSNLLAYSKKGTTASLELDS